MSATGPAKLLTTKNCDQLLITGARWLGSKRARKRNQRMREEVRQKRSCSDFQSYVFVWHVYGNASILQYWTPKRLSFPLSIQGVVFNACVVLLFLFILAISITLRKIIRVGQNFIFKPYMTVYLEIFLQKLPYKHCVYDSGQPFKSSYGGRIFSRAARLRGTAAQSELQVLRLCLYASVQA